MEQVIPTKLDLTTLDQDRFKRLYDDSRTINTLCILWGLAAVFCLAALVSVALDGEIPVAGKLIASALVLLVIGFYAATIYGCLAREGWGRICGFILCIVMLTGIPIGTIIGILGLLAFRRTRVLFSPTAIPHRELKAEYQRRKEIKY